MWRRLVSSAQLRTLAASQRQPYTTPNFTRSLSSSLSSSTSPFQTTSPLFSHHATSASGLKKKKVEDIMPIATGHEREELEAALQGTNILEMNYPAGPFGTKEAPAIVQSVYDKRIVGCPGGEGEDEHDVVWFWLEKGKPHECPVCCQYFLLEVVGPGGPPDGHGDDHHHH